MRFFLPAYGQEKGARPPNQPISPKLAKSLIIAALLWTFIKPEIGDKVKLRSHHGTPARGETVAVQAGVTPGQVSAVAAHVKMRPYEKHAVYGILLFICSRGGPDDQRAIRALPYAEPYGPPGKLRRVVHNNFIVPRSTLHVEFVTTGNPPAY
jgi:hypothetical protein